MSSYLEKLILIEKEFIRDVKKYIGAQGILIFITFLQVLLGLWFLELPHPVVMGMITSFCDLLPVLGPAAILIPGSIYLLITGGIRQGIGLIVLFVIMTVVRYILEPIIVGKKLDLHPLLLFITMAVGFLLLGGLGVIFAPFALILIKIIIRVSRY